jgi:CoA:oxalate CoA-transferase
MSTTATAATLRMPDNPWIFSVSELSTPGAPAFQGEHNEDLERALMPEDQIRDMQQRNVVLSRR